MFSPSLFTEEKPASAASSVTGYLTVYETCSEWENVL